MTCCCAGTCDRICIPIRTGGFDAAIRGSGGSPSWDPSFPLEHEYAAQRAYGGSVTPVDLALGRQVGFHRPSRDTLLFGHVSLTRNS